MMTTTSFGSMKNVSRRMRNCTIPRALTVLVWIANPPMAYD